MNTLTITATIPSLSSLTPVATNTYAFVVNFLNAAGNALNSSYIPNSYSTTVVTTSTTFQVKVPVTDGNYTINNVTVKLYAGTDTNCCFASTVQNLVNTQLSQPVYDGSYTETVNGRTYKYVNDRDMSVDILPDGNVRLIYDEITASNTGKQLKGWLMNSQYGQVPDSEKDALRSAGGLAFPNQRIDADYRVYYAATDTVSTFSELGSKDFQVFSSGNKNANSKEIMYVMLSISKNVNI